MMTDESAVREGYLVIADISGYTKFVTTTELEHAQSIVQELTALLRGCLAPPLRFIKLEADAVLCCGEDEAIEDGERLLELVEVSYLEFCTRRDAMATATTCTCTACAAIGALDLKFVAHHGRYLLESIEHGHDVSGPDVIRVHRLLKNTVTARSGLRAYALFTDACLDRLPASLGLPKHVEDQESLGEIAGGVYDLAPVLEGRRHAPPRFVSPEDADFQFSFSASAPASVVWRYLVEPEKRQRWQVDMKEMRTEPNARGRLGNDAAYHCDHGSWQASHRFVDWKPFHYFTTADITTKRSFSAPPNMTSTIELSPTPNGASVSIRFRFDERGWWQRLQLRLFAPLLRRQLAADARRLNDLLASTRASAG